MHVDSVIDQLWQTIISRYKARPKDSYTAKLFEQGVPRIAQKVVEEAGELAIAACWRDNENPLDIIGEAADLIYHMMVLLVSTEHDINEVKEILVRRHQQLQSPSSQP